jgi:hypothetical protein
VKLNKQFQLPNYDFNARFSFYIIYFFVVSFYGFLVPESTLLLIIFYSLLFWIDKYNLFRRFSFADDLNYRFAEMVLRIFETSLIFFAVGNFAWDLKVHFDSTAGYTVMNVITILLAVSYNLLTNLAYRFFDQKIVRNKYKPDIRAYSYLFSKKHKDVKTFFSENPATFCLEDERLLDYRVIYEPNEVQKASEVSPEARQEF